MAARLLGRRVGRLSRPAYHLPQAISVLGGDARQVRTTLRSSWSNQAEAKPTILLVDDDPEVRDSIMDVLEVSGYRVMTAANGLEGIELLRSEPEHPDLILLDMLMPVMDGREFRAEQQKDPELAEIPVVVITAYGVPEDQEEAFRSVEVLEKPFALTALLDTVAAATERASPPSRAP
jgi:CheY-like chemotaxis protein